MADVVMVMYLGKVAEIGTATAIFERPAHPYTAALLDSMPAMDPDQRTEEAPLYGDPPNPINPPSGCRFHTLCRYVTAVCSRMVHDLARHDDHQLRSEEGGVGKESVSQCRSRGEQ